MIFCSSELQDVFIPFLELKFGTSFKRKYQLHYKAYEMLCERVKIQYCFFYYVRSMKSVISFVVVGPGDAEPELQTFDSEDVNDSAPEKLLKVTEEKPERSKDSTIHTAHQYLMDLPQVGYPVCLLSASAGETDGFT